MQILVYLISVHFWWTLHQTQISFSTAELCHKTHKRSKSSRNFSHQLLQRTTKFWASFDVSPYFIFFVDASTNHFYCSGQWLRVFKWQILCLTLSLTYIYTPLCRYWIALYRHILVFIMPHVDIELEDNKQFISNIPRIARSVWKSGVWCQK